MKFETINGKLCRMVEPEPLTPEAQFPCVVRLIQDDSPMGRSNAFHLSPLLANNSPIIIDAVKDYSVSVVFNNMIFYYANFEIIGYPVADGSAEWALYQMMQGKWVVCDGLHPPCHLHANMVTWMVSKFPARWEMQSPDKWVLYCTTNTGWQLYEPKPEPQPAYAVGDWVEVSGRGRTIHGKCVSTEGTVSEPSNMIRACGYLFNPDGTDAKYRCKTHGYLITRKLQPSEVVVHIGCMSGTVEKASDFDLFLLWHSKNDCDYSMIRFDALDEPTQTIVKELLDKQGEEK